MRERVFLYREKEVENLDRDCCAYIENKPMRFECGHYFGSVILEGACYSGHDFPEYENIDTVLSESEYNALVKFARDIDNLGYGITEGDERYNKGIELCEAIQPVYDKLNSREAELFFAEIVESEREVMKQEYDLSDSDIDRIFASYSLEYRDRAIMLSIYDSAYDLGYEEAYGLGYISRDIPLADYIDFEQFGLDLIDDEYYVELADGRVAALAY